MCTPFKDYERQAHGAISEIISAMSALNMEARPVPVEKSAPIIAEQGYIFLSESDEWVKHSMEHLRQAIDTIQLAESFKRCAEDELRKLYKHLGETDEVVNEKMQLITDYLNKI